MNGYIQVQIGSQSAWQVVVDGTVAKYVNTDGTDFTPPKVYEEHVVTGELLAAPQ